MIPKGNIYVPVAPTDYVKGVNSPISIPPRNVAWSTYLPTYEPQKYTFDTNSCWCLSGINIVETQLNYLKSIGAFGSEAMQFFVSNGYIDSSGSFSLSERFIEILSGAKGNGNSQWNFWQLASTSGLIPRSMLCYTQAQANQYGNEPSFYADYFSVNDVTPAMVALGKQFLTYVDIAYQWIHNDPTTSCPIATIQSELAYTPLHLGIPVNPDWNQVNVPYEGNTDIAHAIEGYGVSTLTPSVAIRDQYQPDDKVLAAGYFIPLVTAGVVTVAVPPAPSAPAQPSITQQKISIMQQIIAAMKALVIAYQAKKTTSMNKTYGVLSSLEDPTVLAQDVSAFLKIVSYFIATLSAIKGANLALGPSDITASTDAIVSIIGAGFTIYQSGQFLEGVIKRVAAGLSK